MFRPGLNCIAALLMLFAVSCKKVKLDRELGRISAGKITEKEDQLFLHGNERTVVLHQSSCKIESGGIQITLPDEVLKDADGVWHLPKRSVAYLEGVFSPEKLHVRRIVIDPGHGGSDPGAVSITQKAEEKDLNLDLALKLGSALQQYGVEVVYTRDDDSTVALGARGKKFKADLFISIHHNASENISASGAETYCLLSYNAVDKSKIISALKIACEMQKAQSHAFGNYGRGVKFANFKVLRDSDCPAILFETGFLSNPDDEKKCLAPQWRQIMAESLAKGIIRAVSL